MNKCLESFKLFGIPLKGRDPLKRTILALSLSASLLAGQALAANLPTLRVNGAPVPAVHAVENGTTYVGLRAVSRSLDPQADISWSEDTAAVHGAGLSLAATPGLPYLTANGRYLYIPAGVRAENGRVLVPIRVLADAFGAEVTWNGAAGEILVESGSSIPEADYDPDELYWLSRIISAESRGEPLNGRIAVGNVVLNRVAHPDFPNTIYGVIFDDRWGGQFEPVRNGTVYQTPTGGSLLAAKLVLEGADVVDDCLYFLNPVLAQNFWTVENRPFHTTIGCHDFYR